MIEKVKNWLLSKISLSGFFEELRRRWLLLAVCVVVFAAIAGMYSYAKLPPVNYSYLVRLLTPLNTNERQIKTCAEKLRSDIGHVGQLVKVSQVPNSHVLTLTFTGPDRTKIQDSMKKYLPQAKGKVENILVGAGRTNFRKKVQSDFRKYLATTKVANDPKVAAEAAKLEKLLVTHMEKKATFPTCALLLPSEATLLIPEFKPGKTMISGALGGFIVGCSCILCLYVYKKAKKT